MKLNQWHVRLGNDTFGPLTDTELRKLARKGSVTRATQVSPDGVNWTAANSIKGLQFGPPPVVPPNPSVAGVEQTPTIQSRLVPGFIGAAIMLAILVLVGLFGTDTQKSTSVQESGAVRDDKAATQTRMRQSAFDYWGKASQSLKRLSGVGATADSDPAGAASQYRSVSSALEILPTKDVDSDAVKSIMAVSAVLRELADDIEESHDAGCAGRAFVIGMYGGWSGDFAPAMSELDSLEKTRRIRLQHYKDARQLVSETRAILSSRYGVEFPPL